MTHRTTMIALLSGFLSVGAAWASEDNTGAVAKVTDAQKAAVRKQCTRDFMAHCIGVRPGGLPAFQCLNKHMSSLSSGCQTAVRDILADVR